MHNKCWNIIKNNLKNDFSSEQLTSWIEPIEAVSFKDNTLTLEIPNIFFEKWIKKYYLDSFNQALLNENQFKKAVFAFKIKEKQHLKVTKQPATKTKIINNNKYKKELKINNSIKNTLNTIKPNTTHTKYNLDLKTEYTFQKFFTGKTNLIAKTACQKIIQEQGSLYNPLLIQGDAGTGKTHLLQATANEIILQHPEKKVIYITSEAFMNQFIKALKNKTIKEFRAAYRSIDYLLLDDIQFLAKKERTQEEFFYTFNELFHAGKQIVITSDRPINEIKDIQEKLISRFTGGLIIDIKEACFDTKLKILKAKAENKLINIPENIAAFIAENTGGNIRFIEGILKHITAYTSFAKKPLSMNFIENLIKKSHSQIKKFTITNIVNTVASYFKLSSNDIIGNNKTRKNTIPRYLAIYLTKNLTKKSLENIGEDFGGRSHSAVISAITKAKDTIKSNNKISKDYQILETMISK